MAQSIRFSEHLIMEGYSYGYGISAADIGGDGDLDLVSADAHKGLYWFENDGQGSFTKHIIHDHRHPSIVESGRVVYGSKGPKGRDMDVFTYERLERNAVGDLNGNGLPDVVIVDNANASVLWFENSGRPAEDRGWKMHFITEGGLPFAYDVALADFTGNGALDVAASSWIGGRFVWFENREGRWVQHTIEENLGETRSIAAVDFTGDGTLDVFGTALNAGQVVWYENSGDPAARPWKKHVIATDCCPLHGHPVDMNGDGNVDVIMALTSKRGGTGKENRVVWYENSGDPRRVPWKEHVICDHFPDASEAVAADLDGDGEMEVVAAAWGQEGRVVLFKHQGDPKGPWSMQVLKENWPKANQVMVADLNGDGRPDVAAVAERGSNEFRWWRNEGA
jgi:hypothetical protein